MTALEIERWKLLPDIGCEVSDFGRVKSRGQIRKTHPNSTGHLRVRFAKRGKTYQVHHLVLFAFLGPRPAGMEGRHLNGEPADNRFENLVWDTHSVNAQDRLEHGTRKLTVEQIIEIKKALTCGSKLKPLAQRFGVHFSMISCIKLGKVYADIRP